MRQSLIPITNRPFFALPLEGKTSRRVVASSLAALIAGGVGATWWKLAEVPSQHAKANPPLVIYPGHHESVKAHCNRFSRPLPLLTRDENAGEEDWVGTGWQAATIECKHPGNPVRELASITLNEGPYDQAGVVAFADRIRGRCFGWLLSSI